MPGPERDHHQRRGALFVLSAPSGGGKSTIARAILRRFPGMLFSVSATTRKKREGEQDGREYFFLTREDFQRRIESGDLVEWEEIYGDYYGTLRTEIERAVGGGKDMLFDIDVKGGLAIKRQFAEAVLIFLAPPSESALRERLARRKTESPETLARRMERVPLELKEGSRFDYQVINDDLRRAKEEVFSIIRKHQGRS